MVHKHVQKGAEERWHSSWLVSARVKVCRRGSLCSNFLSTDQQKGSERVKGREGGRESERASEGARARRRAVSGTSFQTGCLGCTPDDCRMETAMAGWGAFAVL